MPMRSEKTYVSTIDPNAGALALKFGLGVEIAEYCTAYNMDQYFEQTDLRVRDTIKGIPRRILHAPFNELFPCAIDPKARELAACRYGQAIKLAKDYHAEKIVIHSGHAPAFYYDCWFEEKSVAFWKQFLETLPKDAVICLENVLETQPEPLLHVLETVADERLTICFDMGHAHAYSQRPTEAWLELFAPFISHFHIHNNNGAFDSHSHLFDGTMDMEAMLRRAVMLCPDAGFTLEVSDAGPDIKWLRERELLI